MGQSETAQQPTTKDDIFVDFKGWRFRTPFRCLCCGKMVSLGQFCFGRICAPCDTGHCDHPSYNGCFSGPRELIDPRAEHFLPEDRWLNPPEGLASHPRDCTFELREEVLRRAFGGQEATLSRLERYAEKR